MPNHTPEPPWQQLLSVDCPDPACEARPTERCKTLDGQVLWSSHGKRRNVLMSMKVSRRRELQEHWYG